MAELIKTKITGLGFYVPEKVLTNYDLEKMVDTSNEWIVSMTGINERRIAADNQPSSELGTKAAERAIASAGIDADDIDMVIVATITPDMVFPATACLIQANLGIKETATMDLEAACTGFIYGLTIARQFIATGEYKNVLVVAVEVLSKITDWTDRSTCVLFGDGAGAAVVSANSDGSGSDFLSTYLGGDGNFKDILYLPAGGSAMPASEATVKNGDHFMKMNGPETYKAAVTKMRKSVNEVLKKAGKSKEDIDLLIPHQANMRIIDSLKKYLKLPDEKAYVNLDKYGNTSAATTAIGLAEVYEKGIIKRGDLVVLCAFGGGLTWGAILIQF